MQLTMELNVTVPSMGRFGTTISSLADLNGDRLRDVAVGAPLEDENRGAVYIYLGDRHRGIHSTFSQVNRENSSLCLVLFLEKKVDIPLDEDNSNRLGNQLLCCRQVKNSVHSASGHPCVLGV